MKKYVFKLTVIEGADKGKVFLLLRDRETLGRGADNTLALGDVAASKSHCEIIRSGQQHYIKDQRSRNGTLLNGIRLTARQFFELQPGSEVKVGNTLLHVALEEGDYDENEDLEEDTAEPEMKVQPVAGGPSTAYRGIAVDREAGRPKKMRERTLPFYVDAGRNVAGIFKILSFVSAAEDREYMLQKSLELLLDIIGAERGFVFLEEDLRAPVFKPAVLKTRKGEENVPAESVSRTVIDAVMGSGSPLLSTDVAGDPGLSASDSLIGFNIQSVAAAPIKSHGRTFGLLYFDTTSKSELLKREDIELLTAVGMHLGTLLESIAGAIERHRQLVEFSGMMVSLVESKTLYACGHSRRVAAVSMALADEIGISRVQRNILQIASLLHDIGMASVPNEILNKRGKLTEEELELVRKHPAAGAGLLKNIIHFDEAADMVRCHHERVDGKGYPSGLSGENIPLLARIMSVADAFEAMTSDRPYRQGMSAADAMKEILGHAGTRFDEKIVKAFQMALKGGRI